MSNVVPEGVPAPIPSSSESEVVQVVKAGLSAAHVAGGGVGGILGGVIAEVLEKYAGVHISLVDASCIGSVALAAGIGLGHVISRVGVFGAFKQLLHGSGSASA